MQCSFFGFEHHTNVRCIINSAWETVTVQGIWSLGERHTAFVQEMRPWMTIKQLIAIDRNAIRFNKKFFFLCTNVSNILATFNKMFANKFDTICDKTFEMFVIWIQYSSKNVDNFFRFNYLFLHSLYISLTIQ